MHGLENSEQQTQIMGAPEAKTQQCLLSPYVRIPKGVDRVEGELLLLASIKHSHAAPHRQGRAPTLVVCLPLLPLRPQDCVLLQLPPCGPWQSPAVPLSCLKTPQMMKHHRQRTQSLTSQVGVVQRRVAE